MSADEMRKLYSGQSLDLYWTYNVVCPSLPEYLKMVDNSASILYNNISRLFNPSLPQPLSQRRTDHHRNRRALPSDSKVDGGMLSVCLQQRPT